MMIKASADYLSFGQTCLLQDLTRNPNHEGYFVYS